MNDCLYTKLIGTLQGSDAPILECFTLKTGIGNCKLEVNGSTPMSLEIIGSGYFTDSTYTTIGEKTATTTKNVVNTLYIKTTEQCIVNIIDNYNNVVLTLNNVYAPDLGFTKFREIMQFFVQNSNVVSDNEGELFIAPLATRVEIQNDCSFKFNLAQVNNNTSIYVIFLPNNNNVYGSITNLYTCVNLTSLNVNIDYNVEDLAVGWLGNSKTKTCTIDGKKKKINGTVYTQRVKVVYPGGNNITITDNSDNTIATYNGSSWSYNS